MNGHKARAMRRAARRMTTGMPSHQLLSDEGREVEVPTGKLDSMGKPLVRYAAVAGTARHAPTSTRAVYQKLKRIYGRVAMGVLK